MGTSKEHAPRMQWLGRAGHVVWALSQASPSPTKARHLHENLHSLPSSCCKRPPVPHLLHNHRLGLGRKAAKQAAQAALRLLGRLRLLLLHLLAATAVVAAAAGIAKGRARGAGKARALGRSRGLAHSNFPTPHQCSPCHPQQPLTTPDLAARQGPQASPLRLPCPARPHLPLRLLGRGGGLAAAEEAADAGALLLSPLTLSLLGLRGRQRVGPAQSGGVAGGQRSL